MTMRRSFQTSRVERDGNKVHLKQVTCARCGDVGDVASDYSTTAAASKFRSIGWLVGNNPNHDKCPACVRAAKKKSDQQPEQEKEPVMASEPEKVVKISTAQSYVHADAPRSPSRLEISRIIDALSDAYPVVDKGYLAGFSDESVAGKLDMPRAWVTAERDRCFGAAKIIDFAAHAESIRDLKAKIEHVRKKAVDAETQAAVCTKLADNYLARLTQLEGDVRAAIDLSLNA